MFSARFVTSKLNRFVARKFSAAPHKGGGYREKTMMEIWGSDVGAYPVMGVIVIAVVFAGGSALWFMTTSPDCRLTKEKRMSIFRGEDVGVTE